MQETGAEGAAERAAEALAAEYGSRLARLQRRLVERGLDWYLVGSPVNIDYLTGLGHDSGDRVLLLLVPASGPPVLVVPRLEEGLALARIVPPVELAVYAEMPAAAGHGWVDRLHDHVVGGSAVGIEGALPAAWARELRGEPAVLQLVEELRRVKSAREIALTRRACRILNVAHEAVLGAAGVGATNARLRKVVLDRLAQEPGGPLPAPSLTVAPQAMGTDPHGTPDPDAPLVPGGPQITLGTLRAGDYCGELERTFFIGKAPEEARRPFETMLEARALAFEMLRPGVALGEIDVAVRALIERRGYGASIIHRTGHGLGLQARELPYLAEGETAAAEPGMIVSIEPGVYLPEQGGFRHSDTVLVTETGAESLTEAPAALEELCL